MDPETVSAITLAVSEAVTNAVLHAFLGREPGLITLTCEAGTGELRLLIADDGRGMQVRPDSPGMGTGLSTIGQLATRMEVRPNPSGGGTIVGLAFQAAGVHGGRVVAPGEPGGRLLIAASELARSTAWPVEGFERLCDLVLHAFADAACVDLVEHGCLRRLAARVHADEALSARLADSAPPVKPDTATWAALNGGGPQLVVHDPSVPRPPAGVGVMLDLSWWLSVPLADANDGILCLWGLGGRAGRPEPDEATIALIAEAGMRAAAGLANARVLAGTHATRRRLEAVLSALSEAVSVTDATGRLSYANEAAARLMGAASPTELMAAPSTVWRERFRITDQHGEELQADRLPSRRLCVGKEAEPLVKRSVDTVTGRVQWLRTTSRRLEDPEGPLAVDIVEDITPAVEAERRHRSTIEIGKVLDEPPAIVPALQAVAELLAPELADGCAIDLLDGKRALHRVALSHPDAAQRARLRALPERRQTSADSPLWLTLDPSGARFVTTVTQEEPKLCADEEKHVAALREIGCRSVGVVPLRAAGAAVGRLMVTQDRRSGRSFGAADVETITDVGRRVAVAVAMACRRS